MRVVDSLRIGMVSAAAVVGCVSMAPPAFAAGDANEAGCPPATESSPGFRTSLPDCRAYEIVSEANSGDTSNLTGSYGFPEGEHAYYTSFLPTPDSAVGGGLYEHFLARRTSAGWVQQAISAPQGEGPTHLELAAQENTNGVIFTADFSQAFVNSPFRDPFEDPQLNQTTGMGVYWLSLGSGAVSMVSLPDAGVLTQEMIERPGAYAGFAEANDWGAFLVGGSADGSRAFFVTTTKLATAPGTPQDTHEASNEIYERTGGHTYLVGVLPDGSVPVCGAEVSQGVGSTVGTQSFYSYGAFAPNGTNVVFSSPGREPVGAKEPCNEGGLFLRNVVADTTVRLPGSAFAGRAGTGPGEEEKIFTLGERIYEYHVDSRQTTEIGEGDLLAYSADGSRVYFLGSGGISVYHAGEVKLIPGTESGGYTSGAVGGEVIGGGRISGTTEYANTRNMPVASGGASDGSHLLFIDSAQLTRYENEGHFEAYVYDAETGGVTCISCNPNGPPPPEEEGRVLSQVRRVQLIDMFSTDVGEQQYQTPSPPFISDHGSRAVFETNEALVPQDVNEGMDVYEWEREGAEGCSSASLHVKILAETPAYSAVDGGCLYMLSSGLGEEVPNGNGISDGTHLVGASENLNDVYIQTSESLLPGLDNASKLYDVRIDGGFPYVPTLHGCEATQCERPTGESVVVGGSGTEAFASPGNTRSGEAHRGMGTLTSAQRRRLARALRKCQKHHGSRRKRVACERAARRRFGARVVRSVRGRLGGGK